MLTWNDTRKQERRRPSVSRAASAAAAPVTIRLQHPTANLGVTELTLTPGLIDDHAREMFLYSQCQMLALAVSEQTGWPLWVAEQHHAGEWKWVHAGVRTPAGLWLDIKGPREGRDVAAWLDAWGLPVRLRLLGTGTWHETFGLPAGTPLSWWRNRITYGDGEGAVPVPNPAADMVEGFAALLVARAASTGGGR